MTTMPRRFGLIGRAKMLAIRAAILSLSCALAVGAASTAAQAKESAESTPLGAATSYLRAVQARDFATAYGYISSADRQVRGRETYLKNQPSMHGFALRLARWFASQMEFSLIEERADGNGVRLEVSYRLPSGDEVADRLFAWNPDKLNALAATEQSALMQSLERTRQRAKLTMIGGRESVSVVREAQGWKVFEDWRSRRRVLFRAARPTRATLEVDFLRGDILVKADEPFQVDFKVVNRSHRDTWVQVKHAFAPRSMEKNLDMIACGSLAPFRLKPGESRETSSAYLFRRNAAGKDAVTITYQFLPVTAPEAGK